MKYNLILFGLVFIAFFLFFHNDLLSKKLSNLQENVLEKEITRNKNLKIFYENTSYIKHLIEKSSDYDLKHFTKFCSDLCSMYKIHEFSIKENDQTTNDFGWILNKIFKTLNLEIVIVSNKEEHITRFIKNLSLTQQFIYRLNYCICYKQDSKYHLKINIELFTNPYRKCVRDKNIKICKSKDYPLKLIDRKICYTGIIKIGADEKIYINNKEANNALFKSNKFSLTKCKDSFIILYIKKLKKNLQLFLGKEEYIQP